MGIVGRRTARPTVVVVQNEPWVSFLQLAALLRRHGVRVVHVGQTGSRDARIMVRLLFAQSQTPDEFLRDGFADPSIVDLQGSEYDLLSLAPIADSPRAPARFVDALQHHLLAADKLAMSRRLGAAGVPVPDTLAADEVGLAEAVRTLGLPIVIKSRVGAGGQGVHFAADEADAARHLATCDPATVFFERFCPGETYQFAAAHAGATVLQEAACRSVRSGDHLGPAESIELVSDSAVRRVGAAAVAAVGGRGLVNIDLQVGADGPMVIDVNLRAWDSLVALRGAGIDFAEGYLHALGLAAAPRRRSVAPDGRVIIPFPAPVTPESASARVWTTAARFVRHGWRYAGWLGPRYLLHAAWLLTLERRSYRRAASPPHR